MFPWTRLTLTFALGLFFAWYLELGLQAHHIQTTTIGDAVADMSALPETPAYYPEGWDRERMLNAAATEEILSLTEEQRETFREGLRSDVGERGFEELFDEMFRRERKAKGTEPPPSEPSFMQTMRLREERCGSGDQWAQWGFVIFKSPRITDRTEWEQCRQRFDQIISESVDFYRGFPGLDETLSRMKFQWIEDVGDVDGSIASIARKYHSMNPPSGLDHSICLYITPSSLRSILDSPLPSSAKRKWRKDIPYVVAVSARAAPEVSQETDEEDEDVAGAGWHGYLNVAAESLLESLFPTMASDSRSLFELGGHVTPEDIYCDHTRWGVHKAGLGYRDMRAR
ncbi:hypothetical protein F5Y15DRAFT_201012 [Xylariaceae sp. FL0016]|nr:hypothetical protein F5Y15DRAFT_201012 [Xylariaceae sp. FL0016]